MISTSRGTRGLLFHGGWGVRSRTSSRVSAGLVASERGLAGEQGIQQCPQTVKVGGVVTIPRLPEACSGAM